MSNNDVKFPLRRRLMLAGLLAAGSGLVHAQEYPEIDWDDLVPKDWDPSKPFKGMEKVMELPDSDPKVAEFYERMREVWDNAPTVAAMNGRRVKLPGYLVPLDQIKGGVVEFLLVPYFGACVHLPPPPANQIIQVKTPKPVPLNTMSAVWVSGTLQVKRSDSSMGISGYSMDAKKVVEYKMPAAR
ncbi:lipoprotein [Oxalicibacterium flavum]|uniref:Lipoprotein n=1 Tax=Oxalicibacterium flavum TaxID=179467 RepID=A0A8J2UMU5_9BURK|nr:DUF3299 domain-containing protein [Oxalicibacterium flavum]GGB95756.1 lipoprotein [Oxalicibacterium flavum]